MRAIIDADIVAFSCAIYNENYGWDACKVDIDGMMERILTTTGATEYAAYISGQNNFRYTVDPEYKSNRKGKTPPRYRQDANAYLVTEYQARVTDGYEADDAIGIEATSLSDEGVDHIICSIDKDLKMIPGHHYNWRKNEYTNVSVVDGLRSFYRSILTGDTADGIRGIGGIGPVKSAKIINDLVDEVDMFSAVQTLYNDDERLLRHGRLLYIWRKENDDWVSQFIHLREQAALQSLQTSSQESNDPTLDTTSLPESDIL